MPRRGPGRLRRAIGTSTTIAAIANTAQNASAASQELVRLLIAGLAAAGIAAPSVIPSEYSAVINIECSAKYVRTRPGSSGWARAIPAPMASVVANRTRRVAAPDPSGCGHADHDHRVGERALCAQSGGDRRDQERAHAHAQRGDRGQQPAGGVAQIVGVADRVEQRRHRRDRRPEVERRQEQRGGEHRGGDRPRCRRGAAGRAGRGSGSGTARPVRSAGRGGTRRAAADPGHQPGAGAVHY